MDESNEGVEEMEENKELIDGGDEGVELMEQNKELIDGRAKARKQHVFQIETNVHNKQKEERQNYM